MKHLVGLVCGLKGSEAGFSELIEVIKAEMAGMGSVVGLRITRLYLKEGLCRAQKPLRVS